jgi:hypothetical protein
MVCWCFARPAVLEDEVSQLSNSEQSKAQRRKSHDSAFEAQLVRLAAKSSGSLQDANDWGDAPGSRRASFCRCAPTEAQANVCDPRPQLSRLVAPSALSGCMNHQADHEVSGRLCTTAAQ